MRGSFLLWVCTVSCVIHAGCGGGSGSPPPPPQIIGTLSTATLTFGNTIVGASSASQSLTLTDNSGSSLAITKISASGPFSQTNNCPTSLGASAFCTIVVVFSPTTTGSTTGSINVIDNASNSPQTVSLTGVGIAPPTTLSPSSLTFGDTSAGTTSAAQPLSLKNNLTTSLGISIALSGPFSQTNNCPTTLSASASCMINVTFAPTATGPSTGTVAVTDNVSNTAVTTTLSGNGTPGFVSTGSMTTGRYLHTATLLSNGNVLIAGGLNGSGVAVATAELYNPTTGKFTATGSMNTTRYRHTATLLNNGQVLMIGGESSGSGPPSPLASAEIYDPAVGKFTTTGSLSTSRYFHTATVLNNGFVLVAGGYDGSTIFASSEIYNSTTGMFTSTGTLNNAREGHSATLLNDGMVLVTGGNNGTGGVAGFVSAELYNSTTGTFTTTGNPNTARSEHTAALLNNGKVLIASGYVPGGSDLTSAELYDPATAAFTYTGSMTTAREFQRASMLNDGPVLITGGLSGGSAVSSAELYDPVSALFTSVGSSAPTYWHTSTLLTDGNVLLTGGNSFSPALAELYLAGIVAPPRLVSITLTPAAPKLSVGSTQQFIATGTFSDNTTEVLQSVIWSSSNTAVATITNDASNHGVTLALSAGTSTLTASAGSINGSTLLTVQ